MIKIKCECGKIIQNDYYEKHILSLIHSRRIREREINKFVRKNGKIIVEFI